MTLQHTESDAALAEKNRRLQALVADLLKKNSSPTTILAAAAFRRLQPAGAV